MKITEEQISKIEEMQAEISQLRDSLSIISDCLDALTDDIRQGNQPITTEGEDNENE